jgi:hypothetical protein
MSTQSTQGVPSSLLEHKDSLEAKSGNLLKVSTAVKFLPASITTPYQHTSLVLAMRKCIPSVLIIAASDLHLWRFLEGMHGF